MSGGSPNRLSAMGVITLYGGSVPFVAAQSTTPDRGVVLLVQAANDATHDPLLAQQRGGQCDVLWGFRGAPTMLTALGRQLLLNVLLTQPCASRIQIDRPLMLR